MGQDIIIRSADFEAALRRLKGLMNGDSPFMHSVDGTWYVYGHGFTGEGLNSLAAVNHLIGKITREQRMRVLRRGVDLGVDLDADTEHE